MKNIGRMKAMIRAVLIAMTRDANLKALAATFQFIDHTIGNPPARQPSSTNR